MIKVTVGAGWIEIHDDTRTVPDYVHITAQQFGQVMAELQQAKIGMIRHLMKAADDARNTAYNTARELGVTSW